MALAERDNNQLAERIDPLADTLAHHIELTRKGFDGMNRHFELPMHPLEKSFRQIDKRLDQEDWLFEQSHRRFQSMQV